MNDTVLDKWDGSGDVPEYACGAVMCVDSELGFFYCERKNAHTSQVSE